VGGGGGEAIFVANEPLSKLGDKFKLHCSIYRLLEPQEKNRWSVRNAFFPRSSSDSLMTGRPAV